MQNLLALSRAIDALNHRLSSISDWLVLAACLISAGNALLALRLQPQLQRLAGDPVVPVRRHGDARRVLYAASMNEHVRVDLLYGQSRTRGQIWDRPARPGLFLLPAR